MRYVGLTFLLNSTMLCVSAIISLINADSAFIPLLYSALLSALFGIFPLIFVPASSNITNKEGLLIVVLSWLISCMIGSLPYFLFGGPFSYTNAWFESVSGFTTTGSTILANIETIPAGLLFWRASTHWLGGIGIIIFVLSVLPFLGLSEMVLFRSELSNMVRESFHSRVNRAIKILAGIYFSLTFLETISLVLCGMNLFDAVTHSFATIATGGFSTKNASIAYYNSGAIESVIIVFMILAGIHFALLFAVATGNIKQFFKSSVVRFYLSMLFIGTVLTTINVHSSVFDSWLDSLRFAAFNLISVGTSTGFATTDTAIWPALSQVLIVFFTLQCACAGSTSGGIKADRIMLLGKSFVKQIKELMHPNAVIPVRIDGNAISDTLVSASVLYIAIYLSIALISTILLIIFGMNITEAFSGTIAAMGNVGPGLGQVGSFGNYSSIPAAAKWILSITMILGRLEIYALFIFFTPSQWTKTISY